LHYEKKINQYTLIISMSPERPRGHFPEGDDSRRKFSTKDSEGLPEARNRNSALILIEAGDAEKVVENLDEFDGIDSEVAIELINAGTSIAEKVAENLDEFSRLNTEVALALINAGFATKVGYGIKSFEKLNAEVALGLIEVGLARRVGWNMNKFDGLNSPVAAGLIKKGHAIEVVQEMHRFHNLNVEVATLLMEGEEGSQRSVVDNIDSFEDLDVSFADLLMEKGYVWDVARNIDRFEGLERSKVEGYFDQEDEIDQFAFVLYAPGEVSLPYSLVKEKVRKMSEEYGVARIAKRILVEHGGAEALSDKDNESIIQVVEKEAEGKEADKYQREVDGEIKDIYGEAVQFYVDNLIHSLVPSQDDVKRAYHEIQVDVPVRDRVLLNDIHNRGEAFSSRLEMFFKQHLVYACFGEIQKNLESHGPKNVMDREEYTSLKETIEEIERIGFDEFIATASESETKEFLFLCMLIFAEKGWDDVFGGENWGLIAQTALWGWNGFLDREVFIDRVFDLQHNSGTIFDKRKERVKVQRGPLKSFLDFKLTAQGVSDWEEKIQEDSNISDDLRAQLLSRLETAKRLAKYKDQIITTSDDQAKRASEQHEIPE